jgi:phage shock protein A
MSNDITSVKQPEESASVALTKGMEMMIAGFIPNTRYFDSRFDLLQVQVDLLQKGQSEVKSQIIRLEDQVERRFERSDEILKGFKSDVDKRFEQSGEILKGFKSDVDKRFEQSGEILKGLKSDIDKRFEQVDGRFSSLKADMDKRSEQVDKRFQQVDDKLDKILDRIDRRIDEGLRENRAQSMRMFTFAMTFSAISMIGLVGKMMKLF